MTWGLVPRAVVVLCAPAFGRVLALTLVLVPAAHRAVAHSARPTVSCVAPPWELTRTVALAVASLGGLPAMTASLQSPVGGAALPRLAARCVITIVLSAAGSMSTSPTLSPSWRTRALQRRRSQRRTRR